MSALWTANLAAEATGGASAFAWEASGVSIDSRTVNPGDLFVALVGPNFDGHDYVAGAFDRGASAAMVSRMPGNVALNAPLLIVVDTEHGLVRLGAAARARTRAKFIAVTGSVGKTGVKEALARLLGAQGRAGASAGNLNNQLGVPLSLARLPADTQYAVIEIGMNHAGEITPLTRLTRPHVAIITTIAPVHMEFFASLDEIADAKAEIFLGLEPGGTAVLNRDNPYFDRLVRRAKEAGVDKIVAFGADARADFRLVSCESDVDGSRVEAEFAGNRLSYRLSLPGRHQATNSLAVLAAIHAVGADVFAAAAEFANLKAPAGRGARHAVDTGTIQFLLIDDSYNASPISMAAALAVLGEIAPAGAGRRIAVLGDMLELGAGADDFHRGLAKDVDAARIDLVFTAGERMRLLHDALPAGRQGGAAGTAQALSPLVQSALRAGDVVLVKGSAGSRTGLIVRDLLALDRRSDGAPQPSAH